VATTTLPGALDKARPATRAVPVGVLMSLERRVDGDGDKEMTRRHRAYETAAMSDRLQR